MAKKIDVNGLDHYHDKVSAMLASEYSSSKTYAVGDYCFHAGTLYECTTAITTAENWTAGHWTAAKLAEDTSALKTAFDELVYTNVLLDEASIVITGSSSFVYKDILEVSVTPGEVYTLKYDTLTGETASSTVGYIYAYNGTTSAGQVNLRKANKSVSYKVPATGVNKLKFTLVPSQNSTQVTATYTGVQVIKGLTAETYLNPDYYTDYGIAPIKTNFFRLSSNLINPSDNVAGQYVNQSNGAFGNGASYTRTTYIEIEPDTSYVIKSGMNRIVSIRCAFYDISKAFISNSGALLENASYYVVTSPSTAYYMVISADTFYFPMMIRKSTTDAPYEPYDLAYIKPEYVVADVDSALLNVPSKIYATSGIELNVYFEDITENWKDYAWNVDCAKGMQLERGYQITPVDADDGTYTLTFTISPKNNLSVSRSISTSLIVTAKSAKSGVTKSVIILGDSTTNNSTSVEKLHENLVGDGLTINTLGTRGTSPNLHEGRPGWRFSSYFAPPNAGDIAAGIENPWYNPTSKTFDASYYFSQTGVSKPDWFFINLGINDMFGLLNDEALKKQIDTCITLCGSMIASMNDASPSTKIAVCYTIPPNDMQDSFGKAYACGQTRDRYKHNNATWVNAMISEYDGREDDGIYTIPIHTNLDTVYNMGMETLPVNSRNTTVTYESPIGNGGVHPAESGYWQIADVYTAFLKANA